MTLRVIDENGLPIANRQCQCRLLCSTSAECHRSRIHKAGLTDTNGVIVLTAHSGPAIWYNADKNGYYSTSGSEFDFTSKVGNQWQPWNPTLEVRLKKVINPIPMYAKVIHGGPAVTNQPVGFDLTIGDWVAPNGNGVNTDIIFTKEFNKKSDLDYDYTLTVSFPNIADGIQEFSSQDGGLRSPYEAPENGYEREVTRVNISHPPEKVKWDYDPNRNYFFRVRTVLDANGNVKSALYGKIYGDFMQFTYYINPTPNSRNMEFDPKNNLLSLKPRDIPIRTP